MPKINWKPLSVNKVWQGKRFKTKDYKDYEIIINHLLPKLYAILEGNLTLIITFGVSSKASDLDNLLKPFIDILQKKYGFNDSRIYEIRANKLDVAKGKEFIEFEILNHYN